MLKIVKSGSVVLSKDVFTIQDKSAEHPHISEEQAEIQGDLRSQEELDQAIAMSEAIIEKAMEDAERMRAEAQNEIEFARAAMMEQVALEAEQVKQEAYQLGIQMGAAAEAETIAQCIHNLELAVARIEGEQEGFMVEYEGNLKWLALEIASRVLSKRIEQDDSEMMSLVKSALATVKSTEWIKVELSQDMTGLIDALGQELKRAGEERITVRGISAPPGTCIMDTPASKLDASMYTQLQNLKEYFAQE